ncbi:MAG: peptide deformylase [Ezakiella sp.]|nr:peptide deformylase [Ezakiella sp.]
MALRKVRTIGDPILYKKSKDIKNIDEKLLSLIEDMKETLIKENGVGLSAVQVGVLKRVIVVQPEADGEIKVYLNPTIVHECGSSIMNEGCLSVPGEYGPVERPEKIKLKYVDVDGNELEKEIEGFEARICCHEIDHTNGILYTMKLYEGEWDDENDKEIDEEI